MLNKININERIIGENSPPYIIAELSANHNGSINKAIETISMAKKCGADAIKIQTYTADTMTINSDKADFQIKEGLWKGYNLYDLYKWAETPFDWHKQLFDHARKEKITIFSTPFDESAVDLLEDLNAPAYKIASFEATDHYLIKYAAQTKKPLIVSTGLLNFEEIQEIIEIVNQCGNNQLIILHCISSYPAPVKDSNLLTIVDMKNKLNVPIGLSDHTIPNTTSLAAIALGACLIEKHFIIDRKEKGPDSEFSIMPQELKSLCADSINVWESLGKCDYSLKNSEKNSIRYRRSLYFVKKIQKGETITNEHIKRIRPGYGLPPKYLNDFLGKKVNRDVDIGIPATWELIK